MKYQEFAPRPELRDDLHCVWVGGHHSGEHLVIPDGCLDILFQFQNDALVSSIVVGAMTRHFWVPDQRIQVHAGRVFSEIMA